MTSPPRRGLDGLPLAGERETRVARAVVAVATAWFALAAAWELMGPILAGHYASSASVGIIAENMLRWHIPGPVWDYTVQKPTAAQYYCHHPWGIFWTTAALMKVFGRHDFVCRLAPVLLSAATPPLLYALGRAIWRPAAGAAAAAGFVVLPIALSFAAFNALEVSTMAWSLLALWGYVRLTQTWSRRHLVASLAGTFLALNADWPAYVLVAEITAFGLVRGFVLGSRPFGPIHPRRYAQWWALTVAISAATLALYLAVFAKIGKLDDLFGSYGTRASGNQATLTQVLASRKYWIELSFTPIAIALGKVAAIASVVRLVALRREHEIVPLALLGMAAFQYVVFKQGADVHVFWPHYFAAYFALGLGALVASVAELGERFTRTERPALAAIAVACLVAIAIARDGVPLLRYARETGGRFNEKGLLIDSDGDKTAFLRWLAPQLSRDVIVDLHEGMKMTWAQVWALGGRVVSGNRAPPVGPATDGRDVWLADTRFLPSAAQEDLARRYHVVAVGPFWWIARHEPWAPMDGLAFVEREPSLLTRYFVSGTEPVREIAPDPYATWELRAHFGQAVADPTEPPATLEQRRIAHDVAIARGDAARAGALRREIEALLRPPRARLDDTVDLVGVRYEDGVSPRLVLVLEARGRDPDFQISVRSRVVARAALSTTMPDPTECEVGMPLAIPAERWRTGFLYTGVVRIRKRPGTEVFTVSATMRGKPAPRAAPPLEVLRLP